MKKYLKIWYMYAAYSAQVSLQSRFGAILYLIGKFIRFGLFLFFIYLLSSAVEKVAGYTVWQMIFVFATFNLIDVTAQIVLREVYRFRGYVISGSMDYFLVRPIAPIFRFLFGGADVLDLPMLIFSVGFLIFAFLNIGNLTLVGFIGYFTLVINALLIALAFHIFVLAVGILTSEVDNSLWLYRDLTSMGRIPVDLYKEPIRGIITFAIPIGIMITFPAKSAFGTLDPLFIIVAFIIGISSFILGILSWKFALKRYSSASS